MEHSRGGMVAVVTGASSGLGRETAYRLASRKARLVLAARRIDELERTAEGCRERGGEALVVPTDVTREAEVKRLAQAAIDAWGRIDVWVNNAGVTLFARIEEGDLADHRRVIETNLFGAIHGVRAVVPIFRQQQRGTLVNVGSLLSKVGNPFVPSYVISKFGLNGLSEALRVELAEYPEIHVCTLFPYAIDTPHFQTGANAIGRRASAMPPAQSPEKVARALVALIERPRRQRFVPRIAELGLVAHRLAPRTTERLLLRALTRFHLGEAQPRTKGNLFRPATEPGRVHGRRKPRIDVVSFAAWSIRELLRIGAQSIHYRLMRWLGTNTTR